MIILSQIDKNKNFPFEPYSTDSCDDNYVPVRNMERHSREFGYPADPFRNVRLHNRKCLGIRWHIFRYVDSKKNQRSHRWYGLHSSYTLIGEIRKTSCRAFLVKLHVCALLLVLVCVCVCICAWQKKNSRVHLLQSDTPAYSYMCKHVIIFLCLYLCVCVFVFVCLCLAKVRD